MAESVSLKMLARAAVLAVVLCFAAAWPAPAGDVAANYQAAVKEFDMLRKAPNSSGRRDLWKALEARFAALAKAAGKDPLAAKILYYPAWTNAELGARSYLEADFAAAAALYKRMADAYAGHAWADDALLRRADLLKGPLKKPDEAKADLELLLKLHPKGDMAARAKAMLAELGGAAAPEKVPDKAPDKSPAKAAAPAPEKKAGPPPASPAKPAVLARASVSQSSTGGRLTLSLDRETSFRYQLLEQKRPNGETARLLYIDLDNTRTGGDVPTEKRFAKGAVSRLRAGYFTPETVRVVLELADVRQYEIHSEADPFRVVLDLTAGPGQGDGKAPEFRAEAAPPKQSSPPAAEAGPDQGPPPGKSKKGAVSAPSAADKAALKTLPPAEAKKRAGNLLEQLGLSVRTVMIDPGHGGKDPGAQGLYGVTEKDVNLRFAKILGETLRRKGFEVLYTRTTDVFIPLETRTEMANTKGADLFVSIHCNSHGDAGSQGLETYSLNLASSRDSVRVAARENAVSQKKVSDLQAILTDLMLSAKTAESKDLARFVQKRSLAELRGDWRTRDRGPHEAPFFVLIGANMPAVLVELGYITNPDEAKRLTSEAYLQALAKGMADGLVAYKKRIERYADL
ncbi:N-acetylmuramoyl-L-alanine amidase [Solidesulfovibrio sp.]|uniref:N-acetylmuramoyl-L-alanine amidase n=1 Tax=Solidesulfovibrio sp. TaxID=2910990 RepID=UPI002605ED33|nr:N-acetylmuramoyl-L-alanine amidase [Solidesulfovibrio sp.]